MADRIAQVFSCDAKESYGNQNIHELFPAFHEKKMIILTFSPFSSAFVTRLARSSTGTVGHSQGLYIYFPFFRYLSWNLLVHSAFFRKVTIAQTCINESHLGKTDNALPYKRGNRTTTTCYD